MRIMEPMPPEAAARVVVTATRATATALSPWILRTEPGLKPYQPTQRMKVPSTTRAALWPGMAMGRPEASKRPVRGPTMAAPMRPAIPPVMWTTPEPAKSCMPTPLSKSELPSLSVFQLQSQPGVSQIQWTTTG